tara:strand:+ start:677 stop:1909 length:1233 start_codon:yes stop_codon:yes gene_type:complete
MDLVIMSSQDINYTLEDLHRLVNFGLRGNMVSDEMYKKLMPDVVDRYYNNLITKQNPVDNNFYKHMKINDLKNHNHIASTEYSKDNDWETTYWEDWDILIDDGLIHNKDYSSGRYSRFHGISLLSAYNKYSRFPLYQPYYKPTNRLSDYGILNSTGPIGYKVANDKNYDDLKVCFTDRYCDNDLTCVFAIFDIGKNSKVTVTELFENKIGCKIYNILYLVRDGATLNIKRQHDYNNKEQSMNIIESKFVQFPGSKLKFEVFGEGSKHNQETIDVEIHDDCKTSVVGTFNLFEDNVNNIYVNVHHKKPGSSSIVDVRTIGDDFSHSSFCGKINIDQVAEDTFAHLQNKNLMVSDTAVMITEPQLDINTKEVECSHGCTVSNYDEDMLYYLQSRGVNDIDSEELLKTCFLKA